MFKQKIKKEWEEFCTLMRSVPSIIVALFILSLFAMNLLANKSIAMPVEWLVSDCGIIVSWFAFFTMDILTKHFGPKAANEITIVAIIVNLFFCLLMFIASKITGVWGESFVSGSENIINNALDKTFGGTWYVVLGSTIAFLVSAIVNNFSNYGIGKIFKKNPDSIGVFVLRTYISTAVGQFVDNLVFAFIVSYFFFGWSIGQCFICAATGMVVELLCEAIFFYPAFLITKKWKKNQVGKEYFEFRKMEMVNESIDNRD